MRLGAFAGSLILMLIGTLGCQRGDASAEKGRKQAVGYACLPGARASQHKNLRREIAKLDKLHMTPVMLEQQRKPLVPFSKVQSSEGLVADQNAWNGDVSDAEWARLHRRWQRLVAGTPQLPSLNFFCSSSIRKFEEDYSAVRRGLRHQHGHAFLPLTMPPSEGLLVDLSFVDKIQVYLAWEQIHAVHAFSTNRQQDVMAAFHSLFEMIHQLAHVQHVIPRLQAAECRRVTCALLQQMIASRPFRSSDYAQMRSWFRRQLDLWPRDRDLLIADRAQTLHTYELIRDGYMASILTADELQHYGEIGVMDRMQSAASRIDSDQYFYLRMMDEIIRDIELTYEQRQQRSRMRLEKYSRMQEEPEYPAIAIHLFLTDVESLQRRLALDRAVCESWHLGLSTTLGASTEAVSLNQLTGKPYVVTNDERGIYIWGTNGLGDQPIAVPWPRSSGVKRTSGLETRIR